MNSPRATAGYVRRLGVFDATMLVIGGIIGAGIFLNPAVVAQRVASPWLAIGVWVAGGAVALAGAFVFAELGARKPEAGGGYVYLRDAWGPLAGFLYGWTELLVMNSGGIAAVAVTFASYAAALAGIGDRWIAPLAVAAIALLSFVNYLGIRPGSVVQNLLTVGKLAALAALIVAGLIRGGGPAVSGGVGGGQNTFGAFAAALIPVLFAYGGWQSTNFVAAELRQPVRDLPKALILGVVAVITTYLLANIAYLKVLGIAGLAHSTAPASDVMRAALGPAGATLIGIGITVSTLGFLNLAILSAPRVYQTMAADGLFFGRMAALHQRYHVPATALVVQAVWAIVLVATKRYGQLLDYVVFGDWIFFGLIGATVWYYRRRNADGAGFRVPGHPWTTAFFVGAAAYAVVGSIASNPLNALLGSAVIATGVPFYLWWRRRPA